MLDSHDTLEDVLTGLLEDDEEDMDEDGDSFDEQNDKDSNDNCIDTLDNLKSDDTEN